MSTANASRRIGLLLALVLALGCATEAERMKDAEAQHAAGELDRALTTLEPIRDRDPGSPRAERARKLAAAWLVEAADEEPSPQGRRARLDQALAWWPESGPAQVRLCWLLVVAGRLEDAKRCLGEGLKGKQEVPASVLAETRKALASKLEAAGSAERTRLLASPSVHHWKALIERFPGSPEAKRAAEKVRRHGSLCADLDTYGKLLRDELARQRDVAAEAFPAAEAMGDVRKRQAAYEQIGLDCAPEARELKNAAGAVDVHALAAGEEPVRKSLHDALWALSDSAAGLAEDLERHRIESDESYEAAAKRALADFSRSYRTTAKKVSARLAAAERACSRHDAGAARNPDAPEDPR